MRQEGIECKIHLTTALQRTAAALSVCESRVIWKSPLRSTGALRRLSLTYIGSLGGIAHATRKPDCRHLKTNTKYIGWAAVMLLLVALGLRFGHSGRHTTKQLGLSFVGVPAVLTGAVSFSITNESNSMIDYGMCPLQVKSNGVWCEMQSIATPFTRLAAGQAGTITVATPPHAAAWRVPVIWIYVPGKWQVLTKRVEFLRGGGGSWNLAEYTNFSPEITR